MSKSQTKTHKLASAPQTVKIIGGQWRGTKLPVLLKDDVRPTSSRVRETLFNWLQSYIAGSDCLDLFAGSGALGLEALSRGASSAVMVEKDKQVAKLLTDQVKKLQSENALVISGDATDYMQNTQNKFDLIFLDPPFSEINPLDILNIILEKKLLKPNGLVYTEYSAKVRSNSVPEEWQWQRQSKAGEVEYGLLTRT